VADGASKLPLGYGEPLANIEAASNRNPRFALASLAGRHLLLCVISDLDAPAARDAIGLVAANQFSEASNFCAVFAGSFAANHPLVASIARSKLIFADDAAMSRARLHDTAAPEGRWILLDPGLRAMAFWPLANGADALHALRAAPATDAHAGVPLHAPVLIVPRVFEPDFCATLMQYYERQGGEPSGITLQNAQGQTYVHLDPAFKRRMDCTIEDETVRDAARQRIFARLAPEIEKTLMWRPTRIERYLVARYDNADSAFFRPHRDNTTGGTAHRKFAVTINLNDGYEGGDLRFPEFGSRTYRAPVGGAIVFGCGLLHEVTRMTQGSRFAFLPFLYDEDGARVRERNQKFLDKTTIKPAGKR
jgi:predicted 2-oxoglutarate/Fe(II)-dependent dioxygenase YbiX